MLQDLLVSLTEIIWTAYEDNSKDNRKHGNYQIFVKTTKNSPTLWENKSVNDSADEVV